MTIKLLVNTVVGGSIWWAGDTVANVDEREARTLINKGLAVAVEDTPKAEENTEVNNG